MRCTDVPSCQDLEYFAETILDIAVDIFTEAEQLEAWVMCRAPQRAPTELVIPQQLEIGRITRWMLFLYKIWSCVKTEEMRTNACSDLFWSDAEYRKGVLLGSVHMTVYVRENISHLIQRICPPHLAPGALDTACNASMMSSSLNLK